MKNFIQLFIVTLITMFLSSCDAIAGIFKAGMGVGIFLVVAVIAVIGFIIMRAGKK